MTPEYRIWLSMNDRCRNPKNKQFCDYGGRGIRVCDEWQGPCGFEMYSRHIESLGPKPSEKHSLDRIDNNGNYEPGNIRWATKKEQQRNKRTNRLIVIDGATKCLAEWAEVSMTPVSTIRGRLTRGWSEGEAVWGRG